MSAADYAPRSTVGAVVSVADRLSAVMGQRIRPASAERFTRAVSERAPSYRLAERCSRPSDAWALVKRHAVARTERLLGIYLDAQNGVLDRRVLSLGSLNICRTMPREVFWPAIGCGAHGVILAHNHPSGCLDPSDEDVAFTESMKRAGELLGIDLYDHLIVARGGYTSLRERSLM